MAKAQEDLATKGIIDHGRRQNIIRLKSQYNKEIIPLQTQLEIRKAKANEMNSIREKNPQVEFNRDPNAVSLEQGLRDPNAYNFETVDKVQLTSYVGNAVKPIAGVIEQELPSFFNNPKVSFGIISRIVSGASTGEVEQAMKMNGFDPSKASKITSLIRGAIETGMDAFGVRQKFNGNDEAIGRMWDTAALGAYQALGTKQFGNLTDEWAQYKAQKALDAPPAASPAVPMDVVVDPEVVGEFDTDLELLKGINNDNGRHILSAQKEKSRKKAVEIAKKYNIGTDEEIANMTHTQIIEKIEKLIKTGDVTKVMGMALSYPKDKGGIDRFTFLNNMAEKESEDFTKKFKINRNTVNESEGKSKLFRVGVDSFGRPIMEGPVFDDNENPTGKRARVKMAFEAAGNPGDRDIAMGATAAQAAEDIVRRKYTFSQGIANNNIIAVGNGKYKFAGINEEMIKKQAPGTKIEFTEQEIKDALVGKKSPDIMNMINTQTHLYSNLLQSIAKPQIKTEPLTVTPLK